jgi:hypothetical protein
VLAVGNSISDFVSSATVARKGNLAMATAAVYVFYSCGCTRGCVCVWGGCQCGPLRNGLSQSDTVCQHGGRRADIVDMLARRSMMAVPASDSRRHCSTTLSALGRR